MKIKAEDFKVYNDISLNHIPTEIDLGISEVKKIDKLKKTRKKLSKLQDVMYAHNKYSVLICLQGMDTAGKDSLIREVFKEFNPRGVVVHSFKTPTSTELEHDYLWRHYIALPERGKFAVFNRTHYENVLISRVRPEILLNENIPSINSVEDITEDFWNERFEQIRNFEKHVQSNGTLVMKFFLNLSKNEQRKRLLRRLEKEEHNWKFSPGDLKEREKWDLYMKYYEEAINKTSTETCPWYIIPADNKESARLVLAKIILENLQQYTDIKEPELEEDIKENITLYKEILKKE